MNEHKLNNLSEVAYMPEGLYLLPDGYSDRVLSALEYALRYCHMRRKIWAEGDSSIRVAPIEIKGESDEEKRAEKERQRIDKIKLYQYLLVLDFVNEMFQSGKKSVHIKPLRDGFELNPNFENEAKYICNVIQGFNPKFKGHPEGGLVMMDKGTEAPLTKRVFAAMKEASDIGRAVLPGATDKVLSIRTYASSYRHAFPGVSVSIDGQDVIFEKGSDASGDIDAFLDKLRELLENAPAFAIIPIDLSVISVSPNYFRTKVKSIPAFGYDVSVTIQPKEGRVLVYKVSDDWECAMSAEPDDIDIVHPEWEDEAYPDDEPENSEIL